MNTLHGKASNDANYYQRSQEKAKVLQACSFSRPCEFGMCNINSDKKKEKKSRTSARVPRAETRSKVCCPTSNKDAVSDRKRFVPEPAIELLDMLFICIEVFTKKEFADHQNVDSY